jgi:putative phosphoesterase
LKSQNTTRVAIISDTHSYLSPHIIKLIKQCDIAIHAGDIGCKAILDSMQPKSGKTLAVCGNNDLPYIWATDEAHVVEKIPQTTELDLPGGKLAMEHGHVHGIHTPSHEKLRKAHQHAKVVVYGHTHKQVIDDSETPWVINPGAAGKTRNHGGPSCLILNANPSKWEIERYKFD